MRSALDRFGTWPPDTTILALLSERTGSAGGRAALRARDDRGDWQVTTWSQFGQHVDEVAAGLRELGVDRGDRVAILSANRREWQEADLGILSLGAISVPVYPTSAAPQVGHILADSASCVCFVESADQLRRVLDERERLGDLRHIVVFDDVADVALDDPVVLSLEHLLALGAQSLETDADIVTRARRAVRPDDVATLVYTSGTTGPPKGAVLTHANIMATLRSVTRIVPLSADDRFLSFLPLSHITERSVSHFGLIAAGGETWLARSISTVAEDLADCRPTIFFAVPRVWEKFRDGVEERVSELPGIRGVLARRYVSLRVRAGARSRGPRLHGVSEEGRMAAARPDRRRRAAPATRSRLRAHRRLGRRADPSRPRALVHGRSGCRSPRGTARPRSHWLRPSTPRMRSASGRSGRPCRVRRSASRPTGRSS